MMPIKHFKLKVNGERQCKSKRHGECLHVSGVRKRERERGWVKVE